MDNRSIISAFFGINELKTTVQEFVKEYFKFFPGVIDSSIDQLTSVLKQDLQCYIEFPYVDKVYRNSYYNFYSTKHNTTYRDCARISFFTSKIGRNHFVENTLSPELSKNYLGYITIRPTIPRLIGRTMLSPNAFRTNDWICCYTKSNEVIKGIRLSTESFPHSSQDGETITCAETTIWSVMEYFGTKYPEYKPVLPSKIISVLASISFERQLPSRGLTPEQISFALKEFGFGTRLYSQTTESNTHAPDEIYSKDEFRRLLGYYIESGIPIIIAVENENVGHAIVVIGHKTVDHNQISDAGKNHTLIKSVKHKEGVELYDYVDYIDNYVVIDDNMPPYNIVSFDDPVMNYNDKLFEGCNIKNFIAPLYSKIYLEAGGARELMISYLETLNHGLKDKKIIFKLFYSSSRSFKAELKEKMKLGDDATDIILNTTMPKFVWLAFFTNFELIKESKANGFIIIDATEPNSEDSMLLMASPNGITTYLPHAEVHNKHVVYDVVIESFFIFANNLKKTKTNG